MSLSEEQEIRYNHNEAEGNQAANENELVEINYEDGSTNYRDENRGDGCWNHPERICFCRGRQQVKRGKRSKPKQKKYHQADIPWSGLSTTYDPCVHLHFKTKTVSREELTQKEYADMLATPKGYRWLGKPKNNTLVRRRRLCCRRYRRCKRLRQKPELFGANFMNDIWDVMTPEMQDKMIDLLTCEFRMKEEEAEKIINQKKICKCPKKKKKKPIISVRNCWIKDFSKVCSDKITDYIVTMLTKKRTHRMKKIAANILKHLCDLTGEQTTLYSPETRVQRLMVLLSERLAIWLDDMLKDGKDKLKEVESEESEVEEEEETDEARDTNQISSAPSSHESSPSKSEKSSAKTTPKTSREQTARSSPNVSKKESKMSQMADKSATPEKSARKSPSEQSANAEEGKDEVQEEERKDGSDDGEENVEDENQKLNESSTEKNKEPSPGESKTKTPEVQEEKKSKAPSDTIMTDRRMKLEEEKEEHALAPIYRPSEFKKSMFQRESSVIEIIKSVEPPMLVMSDAKPIKCTPGTTFTIRQGDDSHYEVTKISSVTVAEKVALARNKEVPIRGWRGPKTLSPVNSNSVKEWALWAKDVTEIAEEWNKWIEMTVKDVERKAEAIKKSPDTKRPTTALEKLEWQQWKEQKQRETMGYRVEKKKIQSAALDWSRKVETKSVKRSDKEEVTKITDLTKTPSSPLSPIN